MLIINLWLWNNGINHLGYSNVVDPLFAAGVINGVGTILDIEIFLFPMLDQYYSFWHFNWWRRAS